MSLCRFINIISFVSDATKYDVSYPSDKANVSAANVDLETHFSLIELQAIGATLLYLSLNRIKKPPWLPPFGRLLKLASEYNLILSDSMSNVGMQIYAVVFGMNFTILLAASKTETVTSFTCELVSQTRKLISCLVIPATQVSFLSIPLRMVISINGYLRFEFLRSSLLSPTGLMVSI